MSFGFSWNDTVNYLYYIMESKIYDKIHLKQFIKIILEN